MAGRTPGVFVSVAHLDDEERSLVLGAVLEEILSLVRGLRGSSDLEALIVFDEVYGFLPPHPSRANPASTARHLVAHARPAPKGNGMSRSSYGLPSGVAPTRPTFASRLQDTQQMTDSDH